ncbi:hypothetical protein NKDENANG_04041 [Candidatus Entotheonellaceae bacterium PAL068K]
MVQKVTRGSSRLTQLGKNDVYQLANRDGVTCVQTVGQPANVDEEV